MTFKLNPPNRAEHLGSLLRPEDLLKARTRFDKKEITPEQLKEIEDKAIIDAVNMQKEVGLKTISDGEYRRHMFFDGFFEHLEGFTYIEDPPRDIFKVCLINWKYVPDIAAFLAEDTKPAATTLCTGKIKHVKSGYLPQFNELKKLVKPEEVKNLKFTLAAPEWYHLRHGENAYDKSVYANSEEYFNDIAAAYRTELEILYDAGCRNVQIDDPLLAYFCAQPMLDGMEAVGEDPDALLDSYIRLYNNCLRDRETGLPELTVGLHLCRGNFRHSIHFSEGGYDHIAVKLFNETNVDVYYLEYDTERAGSFEPLKHVPKHKTVVLGLITSKFPDLEDLEELKQRVYSAAEIMAQGNAESKEEALSRICVSPQCGFASHSEGNLLSAEDMKKKLGLVVSLAESIWGTS
ncbi:UROD/MetE-like protein [Choiromyces venosus 120613-1]|uniref:UROD/MetE-like protein n=1 Tax=Choiromyces venosus 120613-1 TaxID=1336337 RepID=A0A3N4IV41_9PEZI|nr:UROD/MetE-like protein [Choiromyces venosus 120613-1]